MSKIKVAIVTDASEMADPEMELDNIRWQLEDEWGLDIEIAKFCHHMMDIHQDPYDLLIVDYGGLSINNNALGNMQIWGVCHWAEEHPGSIALLWTQFTQFLYEGELQTEFGHIENVWMRYSDSTNSKKDDDLGGRLRQWFGQSPDA